MITREESRERNEVPDMSHAKRNAETLQRNVKTRSQTKPSVPDVQISMSIYVSTVYFNVVRGGNPDPFG